MTVLFRYAAFFLAITLVSPCISTAHASEFLQRPVVREYLRETAEQHDLDKHRLAGWFARLSVQQGILDAIAKPAEKTLTWREYRPIFVTDRRIREGREFVAKHQDLLIAASRQYGVPISVITAIIGVETYYGRLTGKHGVLESLATLAFDYPPRAGFFKRELTEFLVLSNAEGWDPLAVKGSYAGAMGMPQFISSSYRQYAVDFDGDGKRDLHGNVADVIGSVANYLAVHGWQSGAAITERWDPAADINIDDLRRKSLKPAIAAETLSALGFRASGTDRWLSVMQLNGELDGNPAQEVWIGYRNFYVITRYNHSSLYAMAVVQLAEAIAESSL